MQVTTPQPIPRRALMRRPVNATLPTPRVAIAIEQPIQLSPEAEKTLDQSKTEIMAAFERDIRRASEQYIKKAEAHRAALELEEKRIASTWVGITQGLERLEEAGPEQFAVLQASNLRAKRAILDLQLRNEALESQIDPFALMPSLSWAKKFWGSFKNFLEQASTESADMVDRVAKGSGQMSGTEVTRTGRKLNEILQTLQEWSDNVGFHIAEREAQGR